MSVLLNILKHVFQIYKYTYWNNIQTKFWDMLSVISGKSTKDIS